MWWDPVTGRPGAPVTASDEVAVRSPARLATVPEWVRALLVLTALAAVFLWKPITTAGYYTPADILQQSAVFNLGDPSYRPLNPGSSDVVRQFDPWFQYGRDALHSGHLPLWNPYNGAGAPQLGNTQSAIFSPFSLPYWVLPFRAALAVAAFLKLVAAGFFTWLFLRMLRVSFGGALVGATAFMFCAFSVLWLSWPVSSPVVLMPAVIAAAECLVRARDREHVVLGGIAVAAAVALSLFSGNPEGSLFSFVLVAGYVIVRALTSSDVPLAARAMRVVTVGAAAVTGVALAAVQLVPSVEYLHRSAIYVFRQHGSPSFLNVHLAALYAVPRIFGDNTGARDPNVIPLPEYAGFYVGLLALLLAAAAVLSLVRRRRATVAYFTGAAAVWLLYAYDVAGIGRALNHLPGADVAQVVRSDVVWIFSIAVLSAIGFDVLARRDLLTTAVQRTRAWLVPVGVAAGTIVLLLATYLAARYLRHYATPRVAPGVLTTPAAKRLARDQLLFVGVSLAVGAAAVAVAALRRTRRVTAVACGVVVVVIFAQTGWMFRRFNPTVAPKYVYPVTPALETVRNTVGQSVMLTTDITSIPGDVNLWYRLYKVDSYDAVLVKDYDALYRRLLRPPRVVVAGSEIGVEGDGAPVNGTTSLAAIGVQYVVTGGPYPYARPVPAQPSATDAARFTVTDGSFDGLSVTIPGQHGAHPCTLTLADARGTPVAEGARATCRDGEGVFTFSPVRGAGPAVYAATVASDGTRTPDAIAVRSVFDTSVPGLELVRRSPPVGIFRVPGAPPRYWSPPHAVRTNATTALRTMTSRHADPSDVVLVDAPAGPASRSPGDVRVVSETATRVVLRVSRTDPGWLVARISRFPGWKATVDGRSAPIVTANYAFSAVRVPSGTTQVELRYEPHSVRTGAVVSIVVLVALVALLATALVAMRRRRGTRAAERAPEPR